MHSTENGAESGGDQSATNVRTAGLSVTGPSPMPVSAAANSVSGSGTKECAGCGKRITERFLLKALDLFWHEDCLKCGCCDCRLGEVGSTLYTKANLILCKRDYLRLFGTTGYCAACNKVIPAFEMVMRAKNNVYHLECFACQQCNHRFCVGDRFYLCENKILCEYDYEERLVFANMAYNPSSLAHIRRQVSNLQPAGGEAVTSILPVGANPSRPAYQPPHQFHHQQLSFYSAKILDERQRQLTSAACVGILNPQGAAPGGRHHGDDGSSGYGSPDSETLETTLPH
ncbi:LIM/homeobox protein Lhx8-like isoform X2 [Cylas formicarius]|nr:LIM/homeobox protein Lhx8-like isoform X2 [Cylas formicarius]